MVRTRAEHFELVINGKTYQIDLVPTDVPFVSAIKTTPSLNGNFPIGTVRRELKNKQSGRFVARHKMTGLEARGLTRKQAATSLIYDHYR